MLRVIVGWFGVMMLGLFGGIVGMWTVAPYPVSVIERNVLTPVVKPGDNLRVEVVVDRRARCDQEVQRYIQYPDHSRSVIVREFPSSYGKLGRDVYLLKISTDPEAPYGDAEVYSTGEAKCNLYQSLFDKPALSGDPWIDKFQFGPETKDVPGKFPPSQRTEFTDPEQGTHR